MPVEPLHELKHNTLKAQIALLRAELAQARKERDHWLLRSVEAQSRLTRLMLGAPRGET